jgi:hypothetical protein
MARLSRLFDWRSALVVVKPDTLIRWHRGGFRLFWRWKSKPVGRPAVPKNLQELIRKMAAQNPTWGEEHIANELKLKLGIRVSPRTVQKYLRSHRLVQILREDAIPVLDQKTVRMFIRERLAELLQRPFSTRMRRHIVMKRILKRPVRAPKANAVCERLVGTIRRECLDILIPLGERHLKQLLTQWVAHYNHARVHTSLGQGIPNPIQPSPPASGHRHRLPAGHVLRSKAVLGGLHHEYWLEKVAA